MAPGQLFLFLLPAAAAAAVSEAPAQLQAANGSPLLELCRLPVAVGRCRAAMPRWWFNLTAGRCQNFIFGGCEGNSNNFLTQEECLESCAPKTPPEHPEDDSYTEHCLVSQVTGPCRAAFPRWFYQASSQSCQQFLYGGCRGNLNNYQSQQECLTRCAPKPGEPEANLHLHFFSTKGVAVAVLLALLATIGLASISLLVAKSCRKKIELPSLAGAWSPEDDKEYLMRNSYTL